MVVDECGWTFEQLLKQEMNNAVERALPYLGAVFFCCEPGVAKKMCNDKAGSLKCASMNKSLPPCFCIEEATLLTLVFFMMEMWMSKT